MSPVARLLAAAEVNVAAMGRRAVESATAPLKEKARELVSETLGTVTSFARSVAIKAALGVVALIMAIVAVILALMSADDALAAVMGPTRALLVIAGAFLLLAVLAAVGIALVPSGTRRPKGHPSAPLAARGAGSSGIKADPTAADAVAPIGRAGMLGSTELALDTGLDALLSALGEAGFKREQAGLRAGLAIARQLRPMQVASLALMGGFVMGARLRFGRHR